MNKIHGGNIWRIAKENGLKPEDIIDFSASINPLGISPKAEAAIKKAISFLGHYPEPGAETIRGEIASYHNLPQENIIAGNGSAEFIYLLPRIFKPRKAMIVEPAFSEYRNSLNASGCETEDFLCLEQDGFFPGVKRLCSAIKKGCDMVYLGNPANPTGILLSRKDVLSIAEECRRHTAILIVDEAFMDFAEDESVKRQAVTMDNIVVIRSMTKFFGMAGLRLGYIIANRGLVKRFEGFKPPWSVNTLAQLAGIESLRDKDHIEKTMRWFKQEKEFLYDSLCAMETVRPRQSAANYFLVEILQQGVSASMLRDALLKDGIIIRDCASFKGMGGAFFRVAVRKRTENELLSNALKKVGDAFPVVQ